MSYLLVLSAALFVASGKYDPDYTAYRAIYELGGSWLSAQGRDPVFVYLTDFLSSVMPYEQFRYALSGVFAGGLVYLAVKLANSTATRFGFVQAMFLTPIVLLKFHVQIREGMALLLWLIAVANQTSPRYTRFWVLAALSSAIHVGVLPLWGAATLIKWSREPNYLRAAYVTFLVFALYSLASIPGSSEILLSPFFDVNQIVRDTGFGLDISGPKLAYWSLFTVLPAITLFTFSRSAWRYGADISILGMVGTYGLLAFFPVAAVGGVILQVGEAQFANALRVAATLMALLAVQLSMTRPKHPLTWLIGMFAIADTIRLLIVD